MSFGSLAVVEEWLDAVNRGDACRAGQLSADEVEIADLAGPCAGARCWPPGWAGPGSPLSRCAGSAALTAGWS